MLGAGSWGTTVAAMLSRSAATTLWARSNDVAADVVKNRRNSRYTGDAALPDALGSGQTITEAMAGMKQVAEGVHSAGVVMQHAAAAGVTMPIAREVDAVVNHRATAVDAYRGLLRQAPGHEISGTS